MIAYNDVIARMTGFELCVMQELLNLIAERLVGLLATLRVVPIIRASPGGAAQHVGKLVTVKIQELRKSQNSPFSDNFQNMGANL